MINDISVLGTKAFVTASVTFPAGFEVTTLPADSDGIDIPETQIANAEMGVNGDLIGYRTAVTSTVVLSVVPNSDDDNNLQILLNQNRAAKGKVSQQDVITIVITYPNGTTNTFSNGIIVSGELGYSVTSQGKLRTKRYSFMFEQFV